MDCFMGKSKVTKRMSKPVVEAIHVSLEFTVINTHTHLRAGHTRL